MEFHVMTLFPDMIKQALNHSIVRRAIDENKVKLNCINIRDYSEDKHNKVDDYPYGGGPGMVMQPNPIYNAFKAISEGTKKRVIYLTPQGKTFNQNIAKELATENELVLLCGHYEGIDERVIEEIVTDEISIGDFVLTGGELGALVIIDAVSRLIPGVLGCDESFQDESFSNNLLEYPQYTRPKIFLDKEVPDVLLSGHHKNIENWRREQSLIRTAKKRPDLLCKADLTDKEKEFVKQYINNETI